MHYYPLCLCIITHGAFGGHVNQTQTSTSLDSLHIGRFRHMLETQCAVYIFYNIHVQGFCNMQIVKISRHIFLREGMGTLDWVGR